MSDYEDVSLTEAKDLLRVWREGNDRRSAEVVDLWEDVISFNINKLGNEMHVILEQVIYAALDCHAPRIATFCIERLKKEFPGSMRVWRYQACQLEAEEKYEEALAVLTEIKTHDETNAAVRKRIIALHIATELHSTAIQLLVEYLKTFMSDVEAWQQLCELYLKDQDFTRAVFCAEEILLHQPHNNLVHQRVADIRYTMGGVENMELAKSYYCHALKLNPDNMRALLGLILVTNNLLTHYKSSGNGNKRKELTKLSQWAASNVNKKHKTAGSKLTPSMLSLAITE